MATTETATPSVSDNENSGGDGQNPATKAAILRVSGLVLWILTFVLLLVAMIVLLTDSKTVGDSSDEDSSDEDATDDLVALHFDDIYAYRYMLSVIVIGMAYTAVRIGFSIYRLIMVKVGEASLLFDFYGDKFISYLLATGAAAGFGVTKDMDMLFDKLFPLEAFEEFCSMGYASASLLLIAFLCTAALSVLSSYALAKRV